MQFMAWPLPFLTNSHLRPVFKRFESVHIVTMANSLLVNWPMVRTVQAAIGF